MDSIAQGSTKVKSALSQQNRADILALADVALAEAQTHRAAFLTSGDGLAWRRWRQAMADREALLAEARRP